MQNSRLIKILETFSKKELRNFSKFLNSPFFNTRSDLIQLFEILEKGLSEKKKNLDKTVVFEKLFPGKAYNSTNFNLLRSYLQKLLEEFLSVNEFLKNNTSKNYTLAAAYRQRNLPNDFERALKSANDYLKKQPFRNESFWEEQLNLDWLFSFLKSEIDPNELIDWASFSQTTDISYFSKKLRIAVLSKAQEQILNAEIYNSTLFDEILSFAKKEPFSKIASIQVYFACFQMLHHSNEETYFLKFKSQLFENGSKFPSEEIRDLYLLAINFCVRQVNSGKWDRRFFVEVLDLYKEGLEKNYLLQRGEISRITYHNIVAAALKIQDFEWVAWFLEVYKNHLKKPFRESSYSFNLARLEYSRKNYNEALLLLQKSNYRDFLLNLAARTIKLKIYFETDEWDALHAHLDATKTYLRRKKVPGYHRKFYENLIRFTQKLMALNFYDRKAVEKLREQIATEDFLTEKQWFLEQLEFSN